MVPHSKYVHSAADLPPGIHYVILVFSSIWIPGDERSRTNPGHGYPEHTQSTLDCIAFPTKEEWLKEIENRTKSDNLSYNTSKWVPLVVQRPEIKSTVTVEIG
jgi:hypothetical protein